MPGGHGFNGQGYGQGGRGLMGHGQFGRGFAGHGPMGGLAGPIMALLVIALAVGLVFAFWQLFKKAGYPGAYGLLMIIPFVNIGALAFLAVAEWPVHKELMGWRAWHQAQEERGIEQTPVVAPAEGVQFADAGQWEDTAPIPAPAPVEVPPVASDDAVDVDPPHVPPKK
jgi:hypothetical protein